MSLYDKICFGDTRYADILRLLENANKPIIFYGAGIIGYYTVQLFGRLGIPVAFFVDDSIEKQGTSFCGTPVITFRELCIRFPEAIIVPTVANYHSIAAKIQTVANRFETIYLGIVDLCDEDSTTENYVKNHIVQLEQVYDLLCDDLSKRVLSCILNYKLSRDTRYTAPIKTANMYFVPDIIKLEAHEIFWDIGAFTGDTVQGLFDFADRYGRREQINKIMAWEPDPVNFKQLYKRKQTNEWQNVECYNFGAWDRKETIRFNAGLDCGSSVCREQEIDMEKSGIIHVNTIDNISLESQTKTTFIKMDIEGAEMKALQGAEKSIVRDRPKLAISVYHKKDDIFAIPLYLKQIVPEYRFFLRHHTDTAADTVLYAVH